MPGFFRILRCFLATVLVIAFSATVQADYNIGITTIGGSVSSLDSFGQSFTPNMPGDYAPDQSGGGTYAYLKSIKYEFANMPATPPTMYIYASLPGSAADAEAGNGAISGSEGTYDSFDGLYKFNDVELSRVDKYYALFTTPLQTSYHSSDYYSGGSRLSTYIGGRPFERLTDDTVFTATLSAVIPEPSTLALAALGLVSVTMCRRRRKR